MDLKKANALLNATTAQHWNEVLSWLDEYPTRKFHPLEEIVRKLCPREEKITEKLSIDALPEPDNIASEADIVKESVSKRAVQQKGGSEDASLWRGKSFGKGHKGGKGTVDHSRANAAKEGPERKRSSRLCGCTGPESEQVGDGEYSIAAREFQGARLLPNPRATRGTMQNEETRLMMDRMYEDAAVKTRNSPH